MKKLFIFVLTLSTLQAMEQPEEQQTFFTYFQQLPLDKQKTIAFYLGVPTVEQAYTQVVNLLPTDKPLSSPREDEDVMRGFVDLLLAKFTEEKDMPFTTLDQWIEVAAATESKYALSRLKDWFNALPLDKQLFLQQYLQLKLDSKEFNNALFVLNNLDLFSKALENIPEDEKASLAEENKLEKWLLHLGFKNTDEKLLPLHFATKYGNLDAVKFLINQGADINAKTEYDWTPLYVAIKKKHDPIARYLIEQGADVNMKSDGNTPLGHAISKKSEELVGELVRHGADIHAKGPFGFEYSPLEIARLVDMHHNTHLVTAIEEAQKLREEKIGDDLE